MRLGTELPDELLIEIGKFATTWAKIEQSIILDTIELYNMKNNYEKFDGLVVSFKRLRERWRRIFIEAYDVSFHREMKRLDQRIANASKARGYIVHGVWEDTRDDKSSIWKIHGGKEFRSTWWKQDEDEPYYRNTLPTDLGELTQQRIKLEALYEDLLSLLNKRHLKPNFPGPLVKPIAPTVPGS